MLLSKEVEVSVLNNNRNYLEKRGYDVSKAKVLIKVEDLSTGSNNEVLVKCDICENIKTISYYNYNKSLKKFGIYCCSSGCSTIKKKKTNLEKFGSEWASQSDEIKEKIKNSNLEKWGVECTLQSDEVKEKTKKTNFEKFGKEWASQSDEIKEKTKKTNLEKWGTEFILNSPHIRNKIKKSNLEKWGVENPMQNGKVKEKVNFTKLEKWGDPNYNNRDKFKLTSLLKWGKFYTQTEEYKLKSRKTNLEKWGVEYVMQSPLVKEKSKLTKLEKWGDPNYNNPDKRIQTNLEKWGVEYPTQNIDIWNKIEQTNLKNWGLKTILKHDDVIEKRIKSYNENNKKYVIDKYSEILGKDYIIRNYFSGELVIDHLDHQFVSSLQLIYDRLNYSKNCEICTICNPINSNSSSHENEIADWLESFTKVERRKRNLINGGEIDIYLPNEKIAIEFNGLYWHSELFKNKWYHLDKTKKCLELGVQLIHVFEDDWVYRKEIIKSIILNKMNAIKNKIWARKCHIKELNTKDCKKFLIENHIQGYSNCKYKLGLFKDGELVSVMTLGTRKTNSKPEFELIRFCNKINTNVVGSASKLLNYFIKEYKWSGTIVSYADISIFSGNLYDKLGFQNIHLSKPNYYWVVGNKRHHRFKYNKKKLVKNFGSDSSMSGTEIMNNWGYYKIWSCGQIRYEKLI